MKGNFNENNIRELVAFFRYNPSRYNRNMKKIHYIYIILFCLAWVNPAQAQLRYSFRTGSLNNLQSVRKTLKDSVSILQQIADSQFNIDNLDEATSEYINKFMKLNRGKQSRQGLTALIPAVHQFDKQHKIIKV